jgi:hypothetical protein
MGTRSTTAIRLLGVVLILVAGLTTGCAGLDAQSSATRTSGDAVAPQTTELATKSDGGAATGYGAVAVPTADSVGAPTAAPQESLVISTAGISIEVKNLDTAVSAVRSLATKYGATIANLSTNAGSDPVIAPQPADGSSTQYSAPTPGGATITLRVPAEKLASAEKELAGLGRVLSESSTQDDVTQQHVDMKARLKNLQAEESRLRTFFLKAKRVSEMLAIEQELSRVRGDIESMQAQIVYLERQAAMATLTVSLSQPGALVSPAAGGWGFSAAVRDGFRAAAAVTRGLITMLLAFMPLILIGLLAFVVIRALIVRRRKRRAASESDDAEDVAADEPDSTPAP